MRMIPSTPYPTRSNAEKALFDRLRMAFETGAGPRLTAFHSMNLTRHPQNRFGEADFVIVGAPGVLVLEIKGGGISCESGEWSTVNQFGERIRLKRSPFSQAESAMHALRKRVEFELPPALWSQLTWGYGVVFPDCDWTVSSAEWEPVMVADCRKMRDLERWLTGLYRFWRGRDQHRQRDAGDEAVAAVNALLRPTFDVGIPLRVTLDGLEQRAVSLTADQMTLMDFVEGRARVICTGGAGTGKTFLALELARRWSASGNKVLLACQSPWLKRWLEKHFAIPGVTVSQARAVRTAARRAQVDRFDALIVDEGQDLLDMDALEQLDGALQAGLERGRWCFFHDFNNQAGYWTPDPDALALLQSYCPDPAPLPLRKNCRNTRQIMVRVQTLLGAEMGSRGTGDGPEVIHHSAADREVAASLLADELRRLTGPEGPNASEITLLSPLPLAESSVSLLPERLSADIIELDEYALLNFPPDGISFAEIKQFKGLENECVILVDLPRPVHPDASVPDHYVGMTRARSLLITIFISAGSR